MNKWLTDLVRRAERWPESAQRELAGLAADLDRDLRPGEYSATADELAAIDEADRSGVASDAEVEAAFARFRGA